MEGLVLRVVLVLGCMALGIESTLAQSSAFNRLATWLEDSPHEARWHSYLETDVLVPQLLLGPHADPDTVARVLKRYQGGDPGLKMSQFRNVASALAQWQAQLQQAQTPLEQLLDQALSAKVPSEHAAQYRQRIGELRSLIGQPEKLSPDQYRRILKTVQWLEQNQLAPTLQLALRRRFLAPGGWVEVGLPLLQAIMGNLEREEVEVQETILGAPVRGKGVFQAQVRLRLVPRLGQGRLVALADGTIRTHTTSSSSRVLVYSRSVTSFQARKTILITAQGLSAVPGEVCAQVDSHPYAISARCRCQLVRRMIWNQVYQRLPAAEAQSARKARRRIARRIDQRTQQQLEKVNQRLTRNLITPLEKQYQALPDIQVASTTKRLFFVAWQRRFDLPPNRIPPPPGPQQEADVVVKVHQSLLNNTFQWVYGGRRLTREELQQRWGDLLTANEEKKQPQNWQILFQPQDPILVKFDDDQFQITIRGTIRSRRSPVNEPTDVVIRYRIQRDERGIRAERIGQIQVVFPSRKPGQTLTGRQVSLRRQIRDRLGETFTPVILDQPVAVKDRQEEEVGQLKLVHLTSHDGWLTLGWKFVPSNQ